MTNVFIFCRRGFKYVELYVSSKQLRDQICLRCTKIKNALTRDALQVPMMWKSGITTLVLDLNGERVKPPVWFVNFVLREKLVQLYFPCLDQLQLLELLDKNAYLTYQVVIFVKSRKALDLDVPKLNCVFTRQKQTVNWCIYWWFSGTVCGVHKVRNSTNRCQIWGEGNALPVMSTVRKVSIYRPSILVSSFSRPGATWQLSQNEDTSLVVYFSLWHRLFLSWTEILFSTGQVVMGALSCFARFFFSRRKDLRCLSAYLCTTLSPQWWIPVLCLSCRFLYHSWAVLRIEIISSDSPHKASLFTVLCVFIFRLNFYLQNKTGVR